MTPLAELRALWEKATRGPWKACKGGECECGLIWDGTGNCMVAIAQGPMHLNNDGDGPDCVPNRDGQKANAAFIAAAYNRMEALLDVAEAARALTGGGFSPRKMLALADAVKALQSPGRETGEGNAGTK